MALTTTDLGVHKNLPALVLGEGDIIFTVPQGIENGEGLLLIHVVEKKEVGAPAENWDNKSVDDMPAPALIIKVKHPISIAGLINALSALQVDMFMNV